MKNNKGQPICGKTTAEGPKVGYRVVAWHGHPCKRVVASEGDRCFQHGGPRNRDRDPGSSGQPA